MSFITRCLRATSKILLRLAVRLPAIALAASLLICSAPGFYTDEQSLDVRLSEESREYLRQEREQQGGPFTACWRYLSGLARADFGHSQAFNRPVSELLRDRVPVTILSVGTGVTAAWMAALAIAILGIVLPGRVAPAAAIGTAGLLICVPAALIAFVAVLLNLPAAFAIAAVTFPRVYASFHHIFRDAGRQPFVLSARGFGIRPWRIALFQVSPVVLPQLLAVMGTSVGMALGAAVPVEVIADSPGLGQLAWRATLARDLPALLSVTLIIAVTATTAATIGESGRTTSLEKIR